jgi:hypothetical protein
MTKNLPKSDEKSDKKKFVPKIVYKMDADDERILHKALEEKFPEIKSQAKINKANKVQRDLAIASLVESHKNTIKQLEKAKASKTIIDQIKKSQKQELDAKQDEYSDDRTYPRLLELAYLFKSVGADDLFKKYSS